MAPKKRVPQSTTLEDVTDSPVVTKKSRKGQLDKPVVEVKDDAREELFKRRQASKGGTEPPKKPNAAQQPDTKAGSGSSEAGIWVNRAPVLTLWVAVVAQRQGFSRDAGLTFGKAIAGLLAQSKGRSIGVYEDKEKDEHAKAEQQEEEGVCKVDVFGMRIKGVETDGNETLAIDKGTTAVKPAAVQGYLSKAFGPRLSDAETALKHLADSISPEDIGGEAYHLYEQFRPSVPTGQAGWGKKGLLELDRLKELRQ